MPKKNPNPTYNPVLQALKDLQAEGIDTKELVKKLETDKVLANKVAERYDRHQYPNRTLKYAQIRNYNECRALSNISSLKNGHFALEVFSLISRVVGQDLNFQLSINGIMKFTGLSKHPTVDAMKLLKEYAFIATVKEAVGRTPAIYMVNPAMVNVGKPKTCELFNKLAGDFALAKLKQLNDRNDNVRIEHRTYADILDGRPVKYTTLVETYNKEKELPADATTDNPDNDFPEALK